ncbi:MAG: pilus assembly protein, partial [Porticoccaceae bacterium]
SKDHQLYFKVYDDYSDVDGDGVPDTTYKNTIDYYGYFDSYKCYEYSANVFVPRAATLTKYCTNSYWSGNFLNWASMTRMDVIRKILYGGYRSTDTSTTTILERTYLPNDAHSFAKYYNGADLSTLTPFSSATGITLCNTTVSSTQFSQNVTDPPLLRVVSGDFSLWASNERWQCRLSGERAASNGNVPANSGISAASVNPAASTDYRVRVEVCNSSLLGNEKCKDYKSAGVSHFKPFGLLQTYGDNDTELFGLLTGSYGKNEDGGVLRKNIGVLSDEINVNTDGTFKAAPATGGIINTLNKLRIYGYRHDDGTYHSTAGSDGCVWGPPGTLANGTCSNWGNPQSEMFLESLRYLGGKAVNATFNVDDSARLAGLTTAGWLDPVPVDRWCAKLNVIQFNASTSSFDNDELTTATDVGIASLSTDTDIVGAGENIPGNSYFVGENGIDNNKLCTAKTVPLLSGVLGTCPDAPSLSGSYQIAGLAYHVRINDLRSDRQKDQKVTTYGVSLAPAVPNLVIPVPGGGAGTVVILPACRNTSISASAACAIVDFKIVSQNVVAGTGKVYVNWEDSEQGGDFDQDMWGILEYQITAGTITITTDAIAQSTGYAMGFGYVISGTTADGFHAHSGINNYSYADPTGGAACASCAVGNAANSRIYTLGASTASLLERPLFYAAKWGGFDDLPDISTGVSDNKPLQQAEWDADNNGVPDRYFFATNPAQLETALTSALSDVGRAVASSSSVATNSTRLDTNSLIYQAVFDSSNWTGSLLAFSIDPVDGSIDPTPVWDAGKEIPLPASRKIFTYNPSGSSCSTGLPTPAKGVTFDWVNLDCVQQSALNLLGGTPDTLGDERVSYLRGDASMEVRKAAGIFRNRYRTDLDGAIISPDPWVLGDIVNSDPWFVGSDNFNYQDLPGSEGASYATFRDSSAHKQRRRMLYVGANDGMLHGFDAGSYVAASGSVPEYFDSGTGEEKLAYVPSTIVGNLSALTSPAYSHQYFVDGATRAGDAYIDVGSGNQWRTVLLGTTGAGGKGVFALDVTTPDSFSASDVLWEINNTAAPNATDLTDDTVGNPKRQGFTNNLGYTLPRPSLVRMANGKWAAIVANGYSSPGNNAVLYIIDVETGELIRSIDTEAVGTVAYPNGLSTPIAVDVNNDRIADSIYAGDLRGNLWKFDVTNANPNQWDVAYQSGGTPAPLFVACATDSATCSDANRQPITAKPQVGNPAGNQVGGGVMVYFGTGKYFEVGDNDVDANNDGTVDAQVQSFYGIWDKGAPVARLADLQEQVIEAELTLGGFEVRQSSNAAVDYLTKKGWFMVLQSPSGKQGERAVSAPLLRSGRIIFPTLIPSPAACDFGGTGRLMELDAYTGSRLPTPPWDVSGPNNVPDGIIDKYDYISPGVAPSGFRSTVGIIGTPAVVSAPGKPMENKCLGGTGGRLCVGEDNPGGPGRQSWKQLQ